MGILAALSLTSCLGPPVSEELTIEVHAPTEATRLEVEAAASFILPVLEERFGVRSGPVTIVVDPSSDTETRGAATGPKGITLFRIALPWIYAGVAHESVHWLLHWQASYWNALPIAVEEGLAQLAFHEFGGIPPPENEIVGDDVSWALTLTHEEFNALESVSAPYLCRFLHRSATGSRRAPRASDARDGRGARQDPRVLDHRGTRESR